MTENTNFEPQLNEMLFPPKVSPFICRPVLKKIMLNY